LSFDEKQFTDREAASFDALVRERKVHRRISEAVLVVDVRAFLDEKVDDLEAPVLRSNVEQRIAVVVRLVDMKGGAVESVDVLRAEIRHVLLLHVRHFKAAVGETAESLCEELPFVVADPRRELLKFGGARVAEEGALFSETLCIFCARGGAASAFPLSSLFRSFCKRHFRASERRRCLSVQKKGGGGGKQRLSCGKDPPKARTSD
jgi:hypothetical protein